MTSQLTTQLGPLELRSPMIAASGTVGSVVDFALVADLRFYGAAVAKSVAKEPWPGAKTPRLGSSGQGMLNAVGIQNAGIAEWAHTVGPRIASLNVPLWGSAVGHDPSDFAQVAAGLADVGVAAVELNLSCPNTDGRMFARDPCAAGEVVREVARVVEIPIGAKLSPDSERIVEVASTVHEAGADWVVLTNTARGFGIDATTRRPKLSRNVGGYSGPPLKAISMRCVWEVSQALPDVPIVGCGGVSRGTDVVEYLLAGASAVQVGTAHFAKPRVGKQIVGELENYCKKFNTDVGRLRGGLIQW